MYQWPIDMNQSGTTGQISSSTSRRNASTVSIGPTGTATTMRDGLGSFYDGGQGLNRTLLMGV